MDEAMREKLDQLIAERHHELHTHDGLRPAAILHALAEVESDHGARSLASLHEQAYCYGGVYFKGPNGEDLRQLSRVFGCLAHSSSWQILYIAAFEEGYRGDPCALRDDAIALPVVIRYLNRRFLDRYPRITTTGLADAYNSGRPDDSNIPKDYVAKFDEAYRRWLQRLTV